MMLLYAWYYTPSDWYTVLAAALGEAIYWSVVGVAFGCELDLVTYVYALVLSSHQNAGNVHLQILHKRPWLI